VSDLQDDQLLAVGIVLNGAPKTLEAPISILELLNQMQLKGVRLAVEVDGAIVPRSEYPNKLLNHGAVVEVITAVGGG